MVFWSTNPTFGTPFYNFSLLKENKTTEKNRSQCVSAIISHCECNMKRPFVKTQKKTSLSQNFSLPVCDFSSEQVGLHLTLWSSLSCFFFTLKTLFFHGYVGKWKEYRIHCLFHQISDLRRSALSRAACCQSARSSFYEFSSTKPFFG